MSRILIAAAFAIAALTVGRAEAAEITWYGQSALKIVTPGGKTIVVDPFITKNPKTPEDMKDLSKIGPVDLILITHGHGDHVGDVAELAKMTGAKVGMNADMGHTFGTLGIVDYKQLVRFNKSGPIQPIDGITVTMVHAEHSSDVVHTEDDGSKRVYPGGEPVGYVIELEDGYKIYHAGDTGVFNDMSLIHDLYHPDIDFLPIGGWFTMDPAHAAYAVKNLLKSKAVFPFHYGTFPPLKGTPEQFKAALGDWGGTFHDAEPGDTITVGKM